jgi:hypothetical protein
LPCGDGSSLRPSSAAKTHHMICRRIKLREQVQWFERVTQLEEMFTFGQKRAEPAAGMCRMIRA